MILSDVEIKRVLNSGELILEPFDEACLQPNSYDLRLDGKIYVAEGRSLVDVKSSAYQRNFRCVEFEDDFVIMPHSFCIASTIEYIQLPLDIVAFVEGKSSIGRLGLFIHNAGWVDAGFRGNITLELFNAGPYPIKLYRSMRICQLIFARSTLPSKGYQGKYVGQTGPTLSRIYQDFGDLLDKAKNDV